MSVVVVATFYPKPGHHDAVHAVIAAAQTDVYAEPGCQLYALHEASDRFVLVEKWESPEALVAHGEADALNRLVADVAPLVDPAVDLVELTPVAGDHPASTI
ncbi:MAG: antibiotic biosynthesis monooxygenase [Bifidobacteriaceae bacterium]|jgi:quinol monooxygenase YgiN|nr:antibiotic biosynthesis monooxygenase [Bifidobacteriaceae bacterium]